MKLKMVDKDDLIWLGVCSFIQKLKDGQAMRVIFTDAAVLCRREGENYIIGHSHLENPESHVNFIDAWFGYRPPKDSLECYGGVADRIFTSAGRSALKPKDFEDLVGLELLPIIDSGDLVE